MTSLIFVGIDPGKSGAIAVCGPQFAMTAWPLKDRTDADIRDLLLEIHRWSDGGPFAYLEKVNAHPKQGISSTWKFAENFGMLKMALTCCNIPFDLIAPGVWQKKMSCLSGGDKNVTKRRAQELFPGMKITHATADAILLAELCRRERS